jgi:hypothetical protein
MRQILLAAVFFAALLSLAPTRAANAPREPYGIALEGFP